MIPWDGAGDPARQSRPIRSRIWRAVLELALGFAGGLAVVLIVRAAYGWPW